MNRPKQISPSPILEAVTEIRFENELPSAVVFGKLYDALSKQFTLTEQLPILQMPEQLRQNQPELKYAPHYRLKNDKFIVNIGQRMISINRVCTQHEYKNWDEYYEVIKTVLTEVEKTELVSNIDRVSVRYINFFQEDIFKVLNLEISLFSSRMDKFNEFNMSFIYEVNPEVKLSFGVAINAKVEGENLAKQGSLISIEAFSEKQVAITSVQEVIEQLHIAVEEGFFTSLKPQFLETLSPVYE